MARKNGLASFRSLLYKLARLLGDGPRVGEGVQGAVTRGPIVAFAVFLPFQRRPRWTAAGGAGQNKLC